MVTTTETATLAVPFVVKAAVLAARWAGSLRHEMLMNTGVADARLWESA